MISQIKNTGRRIITTGCRGKPMAHHVAVAHFEDYSEENEKDYNNFRFHKTAYDPSSSFVYLMLYEGPVLDRYQLKSQNDTIYWENFFDKTLYQDYIRREYLDIVGLPHGVVYNARKNEIRRFDDYYKLHHYFLSVKL